MPGTAQAGRDLIRHLIATRKPRIIVEIGAFVGGSIRQWLDVSPNATVVAIDHWPQIRGHNAFQEGHPVGRRHSRQLREPDGLYHAFLATMWEHRERVIPVRGRAIDTLSALHAIGLRPDLVFIDADKRLAELALCDELFPSAETIGCGATASDTPRSSRCASRRPAAGECSSASATRG